MLKAAACWLWTAQREEAMPNNLGLCLNWDLRPSGFDWLRWGTRNLGTAFAAYEGPVN